MPVSIVTLHPATVHYPIALLVLGSVAGLLYLTRWPRAELLTLTWWPLRLGWIGVGVAVLTGLLAQSGLPPQPPYAALLNWHIGTGLALLVLYAVPIYRAWVYGNRRRPDDPADLLQVGQARRWLGALLAAGLILVLVTGWLGGELVYTWGVNTPSPTPTR